MRLLWLADVLRSAGLTVHEVGGWKTRGSSSWSPHGIIIHETRGSRTSTDAGEIGVLLNGSETAPPPIAQLYLSRTGHWHVIASGRCNHVRVGWAGPFKGVGNSGLIGIEAQHAGGEPWTAVQYNSYVRGVAAIVKKTGWRIAGHKEHQPAGYGHSSTKTDPGFDMNQFRRDVAEGGDVYTEAQMRAFAWQYNGRGIAGNDNTEADNLSTLAVLNSIYLTTKTLAKRVGIPDEELAQIRAAAQEGAKAAQEESVDDIVAGVISGLGSVDLDVAADALKAAFGDRIDELAAKLMT